jgi:aminoglycoside phosphotransferase (APT) family kinase protein
VKRVVRPRSAEIDPDASAAEFEALRRLQQKFEQTEQFGTPAPVGHLSGPAVVVTEFVEGEPVSDRLHCAFPAERELMVGLAGQWLRRLHDCFEEGTCEIDVPQKVEAVRGRWSAIGRLDRRVAEALECLQAKGRVVENMTFRRVWLHGDFKAANLLFDGRKMVGLDCSLRHANAPIFDIAPFLNHLVLDRARFRNYGPDDMVALENVFLDSYYSREKWNAVAVSWTRLYFLLSYWCSSIERHRFLRPIYHRYYSSLVESILANFEVAKNLAK